MPLSSLSELLELAMARDAFDLAWAHLEPLLSCPETGRDGLKLWLGYIVAGLAISRPEGEVVALAVRQFIATVPLSRCTALPRNIPPPGSASSRSRN